MLFGEKGRVMKIDNLDHNGTARWIAGYWLIKRWGVAEFEIVNAIHEGNLHPRDEDGVFLQPATALNIWVGECMVGNQ